MSSVLIDYAERSVLFVALLVGHSESSVTVKDILNVTVVLLAAKLFRKTEKGICEDWYIMGTFASVAMAFFLSWLTFPVLMP